MSDPADKTAALKLALEYLTADPTTAETFLILARLYDLAYSHGELDGIRQGGEAALRGIDAAAAEFEHADEPSELEQHGDWELVTQ